MEKAKKRSKRRIIVLLSGLTALLLLVIGFLIWASDYYAADKFAAGVYSSGKKIAGQDNLTVFMPSEPSQTALIFYPGAKVEHSAYAPILDLLAQEGIICILVKMPFNMAIFAANAADPIFAALPEVDHWFIGGHSMGGAMASQYASNNQDKFAGLILLGAYVYGDYPPENALTIYGSLNDNLEKNFNYTVNIVKIEGGNHAWFGNYGNQKGDPPAAISREEQQRAAVAAIIPFITAKSYG